MKSILFVDDNDEVETDNSDAEESLEGNLQEVEAEVHAQPSQPNRVLPDEAAVEDDPPSGTAELAEE